MYLVLPFDFIFYKDTHPRKVFIIEFNKFTRPKVGKDFHYSFTEDKNLFVDNFIVK